MCWFNNAFGVRHHAKHIARVIEQARYVIGRTVYGRGVAKSDAALAFNPRERFGFGEIIAVMMRDGETDRLTCSIAAGEG